MPTAFLFYVMDRNIYIYQGPEEIRCDPLPVHRTLFTEDFIRDSKISALSAKDEGTTPQLQEDARQAEGRMRAAAIKAFGLTPYSFKDGQEEGWLEEEVDDLLIHFSDWIVELKKKQQSRLISPPSTQASSDQLPIIPFSSDSISTNPASNTGK